MTETRPFAPSANGPKLLILGDSIAAGLGARGLDYPRVLREEYGLDVINKSETGWTITTSLDAFVPSEAEGRVVVVAHGITEPLLRPRLEGLPLPPRWHKRGWMDPRPYFSSTRSRRIPQRIESAIRWRVQNLVISTRGSYQLESSDEYIDNMKRLNAKCKRIGSSLAILEPPPIDHRFYPGSSDQQALYWRALQDAVDATFIPLRSLLDLDQHFLLDRFHPNEAGHAVIAAEVHRVLKDQHDVATG